LLPGARAENVEFPAAHGSRAGERRAIVEDALRRTSFPIFAHYPTIVGACASASALRARCVRPAILLMDAAVGAGFANPRMLMEDLFGCSPMARGASM